MKKTSILVGSLNEESINMKLARLIAEDFSREAEFNFIDLSEFPLYSPQAQADYPDPITEIKLGIEQSDGVMIFTPEYNRSIPGVLKNALDWISRPNNVKNPFLGKKVAVLGVSPGKLGTALAQRHLREILVFFGADIFAGEMYLTASDVFDGESLADGIGYLRDYIKGYLEV